MLKQRPSLLADGDDWVAATLSDLELFLRNFYFDEEADVIAKAISDYDKIRCSKNENMH